MLADWTIRARRRDDGVVIEWRGLSVCELRDGKITWWREHHLAPPAPDVDSRLTSLARDSWRSVAAAVDLVEERQHDVVERVRGLGHEPVRGAAQHVEARGR